MNKPLCALLILVITLPLAGCGTETPTPVSDTASQMVQEIDRHLADPHDAQLTFNGVALVAKDGNILLHKAYGLADAKNKIPLTVDTLMPVLGWEFSLFFLNPATILLMADQRKISLDDPVCRYIPGCPKTWDAITIKEVLLYSAGLPDPFEGLTGPEIEKLIFSPPNIEEMVAIIGDKPLVTIKAPGNAHASWATYTIQNQIIGENVGYTNNDYLIDNLFKPLGITHMGKTITTGIAAGHTAELINTEISPIGSFINYPKWMFSNAKEVYLVLQELANPKILSESARKFIHTDVLFDNYPLTANLIGFKYNNLSIPGSSLSWNFPEGYSGTYFVDLEDQIIIVICSNQKDRDFSGIVQDILDTLTD